MADTPKLKQAPPRVALPRIPPRQVKTQATTPTRTESPKGVNRGDTRSKPQQSLNLVAHVGARVKITNSREQALVGTIYSCDADLVLSTGPFDYHIIPLQKVVSCEILAQNESSLEKPRDDSAAREKEKGKEKERQAKLKVERLVKPPGVSNVGHKIFLMLDKTLPVRWHDKSIVVLDNVLIEPPYGVNDCKAPSKHGKPLERVKELVRNELEKMPKDPTLGRRGG